MAECAQWVIHKNEKNEEFQRKQLKKNIHVKWGIELIERTRGISFDSSPVLVSQRQQLARLQGGLERRALRS